MSTSFTWPSGDGNASPLSYAIPDAGNLNWTTLSAFLDALAQNAQATTFQKFGIRKATASPVTVSASADFVVMSNLTIPGVVTVNLPAGVAKQCFIIGDDKGDAITNNITINRNGADTIMGQTSFVINQNRQSVMLIYNAGDTDWKVAGNFAPGFANPLTTRGDTIIRDAANATVRLAVGAVNSILGTLNGLDPSYFQITNAQIAAGAAIVYSKLSLAASILNADVAAGAAIAYSKLNLAASILNADIAVGAAIAYAKLNLAASIVNADVAGAAAIAGTKISPDFGAQNVVTTGSGSFDSVLITDNLFINTTNTTNITAASGKGMIVPFQYTVLVATTITIQAGASLVGFGSITVNGTLTISGVSEIY